MVLTLPANQAGFVDLLNDAKQVGSWQQAGRLHEVVAAYAKLSRNDDDLRDQVKDQLERTLREHGVMNRPPMSIEIGAGAIENTRRNPSAPGAALDGTFANFGEMVRCAWHRNPNPDALKLSRLRTVQDAFSAVEPSAGGFLIPETLRAEISFLALASSLTRPRATVITMANLTQLVPYVDSVTNVGSVFGGFVFSWTPEAGAIAMSQAKFGRVKLEANKLAGGAAVPNELWADAPALSSWLTATLPTGLSFFEDLAFISGDGAGQPLGWANVGNKALISVAKEPRQAAKTIITANVLKMFSRMLPASLTSAAWIVNQSTIPQLLTLTIDVGTGGAPVALVDIHNAPNLTMLGRPILITEKVPALGSVGDINFVDLSYYLVGDRQAVSVETSEHALFQQDETMLRVIERVDGRPWIQSSFQPVNGDPVSPFVQLAAR